GEFAGGDKMKDNGRARMGRSDDAQLVFRQAEDLPGAIPRKRGNTAPRKSRHHYPSAGMAPTIRRRTRRATCRDPGATRPAPAVA
ncbi:hypothetical protein, partial [Methylobacterium radiotolerans]|uniref:hypothetical protein n=1 Tax=Methylobacterium radiotolerans TaxID=31998 RepID=UPI001AECF299